MPAPFPHTYESRLVWRKDREADLTALEQTAILGGPPTQFDGEDRFWSPEELLLSSLQLCLMMTFLALAKKASLDVGTYASESHATLEKTADGLRLTKIQIAVNLESSDSSKAEELLVKAKKYCIISNALNMPIEISVV